MIFTNPINQGTNSSTTRDWLDTTKDLNLTLYAPTDLTWLPLVEPGKAVNLPAAERARMNRGRAGIYTLPERL